MRVENRPRTAGKAASGVTRQAERVGRPLVCEKNAPEPTACFPLSVGRPLRMASRRAASRVCVQRRADKHTPRIQGDAFRKAAPPSHRLVCRGQSGGEWVRMRRKRKMRFICLKSLFAGHQFVSMGTLLEKRENRFRSATIGRLIQVKRRGNALPAHSSNFNEQSIRLFGPHRRRRRKEERNKFMLLASDSRTNEHERLDFVSLGRTKRERNTNTRAIVSTFPIY